MKKKILLVDDDGLITQTYTYILKQNGYEAESLNSLKEIKSLIGIAAEDTRETRKLLEKFNIESHLFPVHQHNEHKGAEKVLTYLAEGKRVALVTDAGTPAVSDPGTKVVAQVRGQGYRVIPISLW